MSYYRLYCIEGGGGFFRCEEFEIEGDEAAIERSIELRDGHAAELWQEMRKVHSFAAAETPAVGAALG